VRIRDTDWSLELCAGTHVARSSDVGLIDLVSESSVGATNRRVEALVGSDALASLRTERDIVARLASELKSPREEVLSRVEQLSASLRAAERKIAEFESKALAQRVPGIVEQAKQIGEVRFIGEHVGAVASANDVRSLVNEVKARLGGAGTWVVALAGTVEGQPSIVVASSDAAQSRGLKAGALALAAAQALGGRGGGRDDMAQGGGTDASAIPAALAAVESAVRG
jgi:alanyl-tRNA synthetase